MDYSLLYFPKGNTKIAEIFNIPQDSRMMIFLHMKKDIKLVFGKQTDIINKWIEKKAEVAKEFPGIRCFLSIVTRISSSTCEVKTAFGDDIFFIYSDWKKEKTSFNQL